jgi:hypothetical protein
MRKKVIQAIKGFDTNSLRELHDNDISYMNVSKETFIKAMEIHSNLQRKKVLWF